MAIKWKNVTNGIKKFLKKNWKLIIGILAITIAGFFIVNLAIYRHYHPTAEAIFFGILMNVFLGTGLYLFFMEILKRGYKNWLPVTEDFYQEWKVKWKNLRKILIQAEVVALFAAIWYFSYIRGVVWDYGYYNNLASGYIYFISIFLQFGICQMILGHFMRDKLDLLMEKMEKINKQSLADALEIERKSLEKVGRSDQLRVDLITNVSHDLKTPLTSMVGYIELMKKEEINDTLKDYLEVISDKAEKLKEMIECLFSLAKASSGNVELHMEELELNRLIEQIFADMEDQISASDLQFITHLSKDNTKLTTDNLHLYRICQNLLGNALKYSAAGTRVFVKTYVDNEKMRLCLEITNTASYLMDFEKEDIVERFSRGDKSRSTEGNGLGLAIVSTYASALGGEFDIAIDCDQFKTKLSFPIKDKKTN